jgi:predicted DNA-binding ribbon-helix-helix protein
MRSAVIKRSIFLDGRKTSVSLENAFWNELKEIAYSRRVTVSGLVRGIEATRKQSNLSSAIRVFVLEHLQNKDQSAGPPHPTETAVSSGESRSTEAWRGLARRA